MKRILATLLVLSLVACAGYSGRGLMAGQSTLEDILRVMGVPAMQWTEPDGSRRLAFPRGPMGVHTYMVDVAADGKLQRIENTMAPPTFAKVQPGMDTGDVLRLLGPSVTSWSAYFGSRDELVWGWRYCDEWNQLSRFYVLIDGTKKIVRSTMTQREDQMGHCGGAQGGCWCSH
ncbi:MAG TPA: hypothetical protein VFF82_08415 [Rhodocyclaceae bacterium]|nr:hypothetical protein [Rhodocyclaceae bacterium]